MHSASEIAKYFLASVEDTDELLSHLKLQKLLYYAQGFFLALHGRPLFPEPILAWEHGPVVREVWDEYKEYGAAGIPPPADVPELTPVEIDVADDVWRVYGQFSAWRLREMTHETPPWIDTPRNGVIPEGAMRRYFSTQLSEA